MHLHFHRIESSNTYGVDYAAHVNGNTVCCYFLWIQFNFFPAQNTQHLKNICIWFNGYLARVDFRILTLVTTWQHVVINLNELSPGIRNILSKTLEQIKNERVQSANRIIHFTYSRRNLFNYEKFYFCFYSDFNFAH